MYPIEKLTFPKEYDLTSPDYRDSDQYREDCANFFSKIPRKRFLSTKELRKCVPAEMQRYLGDYIDSLLELSLFEVKEGYINKYKKL